LQISFLKQAGRLSVHCRDGPDNSLVAREPGKSLAEIDYGIEAIEAALAGLDMVLPTATNVRRVDQIEVLQKAIAIPLQELDLVAGKPRGA